MPAAKPATTRRTTAKKPVVVHDFDAERKRIIKARKNATAPWSCYGREWTVKRPNTAVVSELNSDEDPFGYLIQSLIASVVKDERADFLAALQADEDLDIDVVAAMTAAIAELVYAVEE